MSPLERYEHGQLVERRSWVPAISVVGALAFGAAAFFGGMGGVVVGSGGGGRAPVPEVVIAAPDTPTIDVVVFASTGDSARLIGSTFSGDGSDTHDSTQFAVDTVSGDWSSPVFSSALGAVETDTATGLDSAGVYKARVRYRGTAGGWSAWSDSVQFEATAEITPVFADGFESGDFDGGTSSVGAGWQWSSAFADVDTSSLVAHTGTYSAKFLFGPSAVGQANANLEGTLGSAQLTEVALEMWIYFQDGNEGFGSRYTHSPDGATNNKLIRIFERNNEHNPEQVGASLFYDNGVGAPEGDSKFKFEYFEEGSESMGNFDNSPHIFGFVTDTERGQWNKLRFYCKLDSGASDGIIVISWNGVVPSGDNPTTNLDMNLGGPGYWDEFYLMGSANAQPSTDTFVFLDDVTFYDELPASWTEIAAALGG